MGFLDKSSSRRRTWRPRRREDHRHGQDGQLQMQLRSLKGEEKEALADLGAAMIALGETPDSLADQTAKVHELRDKVSAKEQEIADVRQAEGAAADGSAETVESEAEEVADTPPPAAADAAAPDDAPTG